MDCLKEISGMESWLETNYLSPIGQLLWYKLLYLSNRGGLTEWVTVDNRRLMMLIQVQNEKTFIRARDALVDTGLVEYERGKKGSPSRYKLNLFYCILDSEYDSKYDSKNDSKNDSKYDSKYDSKNDSKTEKEREKEKRSKKEKEKEKDINNNITPCVPPWGEIVTYFNQLSFPRVLELSEKRKTAIKSFLRKHTIEDLYMLFDMANSSDFLTGDNSNAWKANFDWILKPSNAVKILEGNYANRRKVSQNYDALRRFMEDDTIE